MSQQPERSDLFDEIHPLVTARVQGEATPEQSERLKQLLTQDESARALYVRYIQETVALRKMAAGDHSQTRSVSEANNTNPADASLTLRVSRPPSPFHVSRLAIAALVAFVAIGILAYDTFWSAPHDPVVKQTPANVPAAKLANLTDAKWVGVSSQAGDTLIAGQQLLLQSGSVEITFNSQARVIVDGPAELTIVDATACRLATGRLTAHVPDPAKGFKVHTPCGTVTDLGTEFGVYVDTHAEQQASKEEEQQPGGGPQQDSNQPAVTEVHVFKGQVDIVPGDQLAQAPAPAKPSEPSTILHPQSTILQSGQAVTISDNKVQPLPAADPFKFALDKLNGRPRTALLSEDFETYDVGDRVEAIGPWTVQSGTRRGQGIRILDAPDQLSQYKTDAGDPYPNLTPSPPTGGRFVFFACAAPNRPETFPILAREIDGKLLARNGQVLIEFDILQNSTGHFEPSLALTSKVEHTAGIELGRDAEGKKIEWLPYQCYRLRLLLDVMNVTVRGVRADRLHWRGPQGWVRDLTFEPAAKLDWSTPPRYAIFGFPVVSETSPGNIFWLDNVRIEVISEK